MNEKAVKKTHDAYEAKVDPEKNLIVEDERLGQMVDLNRLTLEGYLKKPYDKGKIAERYRVLKWEILNQHKFPSRGKTLLLTSALSKEGKSAAAFNLAVSIGLERDWQSVLVDTAGGPNSLSSRLGLNQCKGLTDYLADKIPLEHAIYRTSHQKCYFIPIGTQLDARSELLASHKMELFKSEIHDHVKSACLLLDSREVKNYADCKVLSKVSDKILLVIASNKTPRIEIEDALYYLPKKKMAGILMNKDPWQ